MSLRTFYNQFVEALGRTFPISLSITWNDPNYLVSSNPPYSGAVALQTLNEECLRTYLEQEGATQEVIDKVIEILPQKKSLTLYPKSYIAVPPSSKDYCLVGDWVILYRL